MLDIHEDPPNMLAIEPTIGFYILSNLTTTHVFLMSVVYYESCHIPLENKCSKLHRFNVNNVKGRGI